MELLRCAENAKTYGKFQPKDVSPARMRIWRMREDTHVVFATVQLFNRENPKSTCKVTTVIPLIVAHIPRFPHSVDSGFSKRC